MGNLFADLISIVGIPGHCCDCTAIQSNYISKLEVLDYQNLQQKIQEYLHQFFTPSILLPIQNNLAISVTFSYKHVFDCFLIIRLTFQLYKYKYNGKLHG